MNKKVKLIFMTFLTICSCVVPFFNDVKAESLTSAKTNGYGSYLAEVYYVSNADSPITATVQANLGLVTTGFSQVIVDSTVFHFHQDFYQPFTGQVEITVNATHPYVLADSDVLVTGGCFQFIPNTTANTLSKTFTITFRNTEYIDLVIVSFGALVSETFTQSSSFTYSYDMTPGIVEDQLIDHIDTVLGNVFDTVDDIYDFMVGDMQLPFSQIIDAIDNKADYSIDPESFLAYYFSMPTDNVVLDMEDGKLAPTITLNEDTYTRPLAFTAEKNKFYFYYYTSQNNLTLVPRYNDRDITVTLEVVPPTMSGYRLVKATLEYSGESTSNITNSFMWQIPTPTTSVRQFIIIPVYLGDGNNMSQQMQSITGHRSSTLTTDLLQQILEFLNGNITEEDTSFFDNAMNQITNFYNSLLSTLPSNQDVQNNINDTPEIIGPLSTFDFNSITGFVDSYYTDLTTIFPFIKLLVVAGMVTFVMKVML